MQKLMFSTVLIGSLLVAQATTDTTTTPQSYTTTNPTLNTTTTATQTPTTNTYTQTQTTTPETTTNTHASMQTGPNKMTPMPKTQPAAQKDKAAPQAPAPSSSFFDKIRSFFESLHK